MDDMNEIRALQRDKAKALAKKNYREAANTCNCLGRKYSDLGQYSEAIDEHKEELELCDKLKDPLGQAIAHRNIGECLSMTNHFKTALIHLREYLRIAAELDNVSEQQRAAATFGRTYWLHYNADTIKNQSSLEKARDLYERSLKIAETKLLKDKVGEEECARMRCRANLNLALVHEHKKDYDQVMKFYQRSFELASQYKFKEELVKSQLDWGNFCQSIGKLDKAKELLDGAVKSAKSAKDKISLGEALLSKANLLILRADFDGSRHCFKQVYHLRSNDDEQRSKAIVGCKILKKVIETLKELNCSENDEEKCKLYDKLGDLFVEIGCFKTATDYYNKELECALKLGKSSEDLAIIYVSLGQTYLDNDQPSTALDCFYKELDCRKGVLDEEVKSLLKIIDCKIKLSRPEEEIETDYSYLLNKCNNSSSLKRLVLKDYKYYLEHCDHPLKESKIEEVEEQLLMIPTDFSSQGAGAEEEEDDDDDDGMDNRSAISDLTDESEDEKGEEIVAGKALRVRRPNKKSDFKVNEKGETPLHVACIAGDIARVVKLIEMGHPVNPRDNAGWLPIHEAANHGHTEVVKYLIDHGANLNDRGGDLCGGTTPLHDACVNGNLAVIRILIRNGANVVRQDEEGNTPLDCFQAYVSQQSPASEEMSDYQLLINELKEKMKEAGYDFSSTKSIKGSKRSHSSRSTAFEKPLIGLRNCREIDISSPPRKIRMNENSKAGCSDGARAYREEIARQRRPNAMSRSSEPEIDSRPRIRSLINENEVLNDCWLEPDVDPTLMKDRPMRDPFKGTRSSKSSEGSSRFSGKSKDQPRNRSRNPKFMRDDMLGNNDVEMSNIQEDREDLNDFIVDDRDDDDDQNSVPMDYSEPQDIILDAVYPVKQLTNQNSRHKTGNTLPQECDQTVTSTSQQSTATTCSSASSRTVNVQPPKEDKILIKVHVNGKTLLMPIQGKNNTIGWLAERIAERYARSWQLKPVLSLMNKDSAIFGAEDLITDVVSENEVYADVQSWELDPLDKRYEESCKKRSLKPYPDLMHILKLAESSGCLKLNNVRLGKLHSQVLLEALKHQSNLRFLDLSFTDLIINDSNCLLGEAISTMKNLSEIDLKGTGFTRDRIPILAAKNLPSLSSLNLSYNHLADDSVDFLLKSILQYSTLSTLNLQSNDFSSSIFEKPDMMDTLAKSSAQVLH